MSPLSVTIRACSACCGDYEDPDRTAAADLDDDETAISELVEYGEDEPVGEADRRPISTPRAVKNTDPQVE